MATSPAKRKRSDLGKAIAEWMWDRCGDEILQEATEAFADKFKTSLPMFFQPGAVVLADKQDEVGEETQEDGVENDDEPLQANETYCRYCKQKRLKPGIGGHETRCAEKLGMVWCRRSDEGKSPPRDSPPRSSSPSSQKGSPSVRKASPPKSPKGSPSLPKTSPPATKASPSKSPKEGSSPSEPNVLPPSPPPKEATTSPTLVKRLKFPSHPPPNQKIKVKSPLKPTSPPTKPKVYAPGENLIGTDEVFPCVTLAPYKTAQMMGKHPKESRAKLLVEYWTKIDPDGYYKVLENAKYLLDSPHSLEGALEQALASASGSSREAQVKSAAAFSARVKSAMDGLLNNIPPSFSSVAAMKQGICRMKGRRHEGQAIRKFEAARGVQVSKESTSATYLANDATTHYDPEGLPNFWKFYGKLDGRVDDDTIVEIKTRIFGVGEHIPLQDTLQMQSYMQMFDALKCIHVEYHADSGRLRDRTVLRNVAQWKTEIYPAITTFVKDLQALLSRNPHFNPYKLEVLQAVKGRA